MDLDALRTFQNRLTQAALSMKGDQWTPHKLMDSLKDPAPETCGDLTPLGTLIQALLPPRLKKHLSLIKWVVFHLDYPGLPFCRNEFATRNWIAIHQRDRDIIDAVHAETIEKPREQLQEIYAPSLIARRLRDIPALDDWVFKKRWLFRMHVHTGRCPCDVLPCRSTQTTTSRLCIPKNTICFTPKALSNDQIPLSAFSCSEDGPGQFIASLHTLLNEPEEVSARRFANFANLVLKVPGNNKPGPWANYYLRIPKKLPGEDDSYLTEVYVAFCGAKRQAKSVFALLDPLDTILSSVISLVNSEVAFHIGIKRQKLIQREQFQRYRLHHNHTINNLSPALGYALDNAMHSLKHGQCAEAQTILCDARKINDVLSLVYNCTTGISHDRLKNVAAMLCWLKDKVKSSDAAVDLTIKGDVSHDFPPGMLSDAFLIIWNLWQNAVCAQTRYNDEHSIPPAEGKVLVDLGRSGEKL